MNKIDEAINSDELIEITVSSDKRLGFIKLIKDPNKNQLFTKKRLTDVLNEQGIVFGVNMKCIEKLVARPIFNLRIKVAEAKEPINGDDGYIRLLVKKDIDYRPIYSKEDKVNYKNLDYFQMVEKGQALCEIINEKDGISGKNIFGEAIPALRGKKPLIPCGKNTYVNEEGTLLLANCSGIVNFINVIHVNEMLFITGDVDFSTGNIDFPGDVTIEGDISSGFSVRSGGNIIVKGVVEDAIIEAEGNVVIEGGICSSGIAEINVKKNLKCLFIENAILHVGGDITADHIIDGIITCLGDICLVGSREVIIGGKIKLAGELTAKDIGHERGYPTTIQVFKKKNIDSDQMAIFDEKRAKINQKLKDAYEKEHQLTKLLLAQEKINILNRNRDNPTLEKICLGKNELDQKIDLLKKEMTDLEKSMYSLESKSYLEYCGAVNVKNRLYYGTRVFFGNVPFYFELDSLLHCRLYWDEDHIVSSSCIKK